MDQLVIYYSPAYRFLASTVIIDGLENRRDCFSKQQPHLQGFSKGNGAFVSNAVAAEIDVLDGGVACRVHTTLTSGRAGIPALLLCLSICREED